MCRKSHAPGRSLGEQPTTSWWQRVLGIVVAINVAYNLIVGDTAANIRTGIVERAARHLGTNPSCTDEALAALAAAIQSNPERLGLRPWAGSVELDRGGTANVSFPGLDAQLVRTAFRGRRIAILGDSTSRHMNKWLHELLLTQNETFVSTLQHMDVTPANHLLCHRVWKAGCGSPAGPPPGGSYPETDVAEDGTSVRFVWGPGYAYRNMSNCPEFQEEYRTVREMKPDVVIANMGLWWLHLHPMRSWPGCLAERWARYEEWLDEIVALAEEAGASVLLLKTSNHMCDARVGGRDQQALSRSYNALDNQTIGACFEAYRERTSNATLRDEEVANYCQNGTFNAHGTKHLNDRLVRFVERRKQRHSASSLSVRVFNDHDIQTCRYTDGQHFPGMNLARMRLLGHYLSCTPPPVGT